MKIILEAAFGNKKTRSMIWYYQLPGQEPKKQNAGTAMDIKEFRLRLKQMLKLKTLPRGTRVQMTEIKKGDPMPEESEDPEAPVGKPSKTITLPSKMLSRKEFKDYEEWKGMAAELQYTLQRDTSNGDEQALKGSSVRGCFDKQDKCGWLFC